MHFSWMMVVAGALVGLSVGLTGMGGGALMTPILVMLFGVDPSSAVGSNLAASLVMKPVGAAVHHRASTVRWDLVRWLVPTAVPAGFAGAFLLGLFGHGATLQHRLQWAIGAALLLAVAGMLVRAVLVRRQPANGADDTIVVRKVPTLLVGLVGGLIVGMTSAGSGSLIIVMLMLIHPRLRANHLVGTDLILAIPLVAAATLGHLIVGDTQIGLTATILLGAVPGIYVGAKIATRAPGEVLRWILAIVLLGSGLALWHAPTTTILLASAALAVLAVLLGRRPRRAADPATAATGGAAVPAAEVVSAVSTRPGRD